MNCKSIIRWNGSYPVKDCENSFLISLCGNDSFTTTKQNKRCDVRCVRLVSYENYPLSPQISLSLVSSCPVLASDWPLLKLPSPQVCKVRLQ